MNLDPADFTTKVDNRYWPMAPDGEPGRRWVIRSQEERVVVTVTNKTKKVAGIDALVVNDTVTDNNGELVEVTDDLVCTGCRRQLVVPRRGRQGLQEREGHLDGGLVEHGVDGAYAGIAIPADPSPGLKYRQEYYEGKAEDVGEVLSVDARVRVPAGTFEDCLKTRDTTPLEPDVVEHKYDAPDVGPTLNVKVSGGTGREELISFKK